MSLGVASMRWSGPLRFAFGSDENFFISLLDIPKTPRFVERLRDLLTSSRTPSVNVLRRRVSQLALATLEELLKPGEG